MRNRVIGIGFSVLDVLARIAIAVMVIFFIYKGAVMAYDYGYRVFAEAPMEDAPGTDVAVTITMGKSTKEIAQILEDRGLIRDARLFVVQNYLSDYKDSLEPGDYVLNTSMTIDEIMETLGGGKETSTK